jgi:hypothetical protein
MHKIQLNPMGAMSQLSHLEVNLLSESTDKSLYKLFRNCCLAVLYSGAEIDNSDNIFSPHHNFAVNLLSR